MLFLPHQGTHPCYDPPVLVLGRGEATYLVPGRWGCRCSLAGRPWTQHPQGPLERRDRCGAQSGSSAPHGCWQPGHGSESSENLSCLAPSPGLSLLGGISVHTHHPRFCCSSHLLLCTSCHDLWGSSSSSRVTKHSTYKFLIGTKLEKPQDFKGKL